MSTKENPGRFDCYDRARPDEEMFILLARDPLAPFLVSIWSSMRFGNIEGARAKFNAMVDNLADGYIANPQPVKAAEALDCAMLMLAAQKTAAA